MIVVAIIGILAAIAIPKFANMLEKSREGATKGNLSSINSGIALYVSDNQGTTPATLDTNTYYVNASTSYPAFVTQYMDNIPGVKATAASKKSVTAVHLVGMVESELERRPSHHRAEGWPVVGGHWLAVRQGRGCWQRLLGQ